MRISRLAGSKNFRFLIAQIVLGQWIFDDPSRREYRLRDGRPCPETHAVAWLESATGHMIVAPATLLAMRLGTDPNRAVTAVASRCQVGDAARGLTLALRTSLRPGEVLIGTTLVEVRELG